MIATSVDVALLRTGVTMRRSSVVKPAERPLQDLTRGPRRAEAERDIEREALEHAHQQASAEHARRERLDNAGLITQAVEIFAPAVASELGQVSTREVPAHERMVDAFGGSKISQPARLTCT